MSTLNSYLAAKTAPNNSIDNQNSSSTVDNSSKPPVVIKASRNGTLIKQKSQKYTKSLVDMSMAASQMDISNSKGTSVEGTTINDANDSYTNIDDESENDFGTFNSNIGSINKNNSYTDDSLNSNTNLSSTSNIAYSGTLNLSTSETIMEGWVLRKKQLQNFKKYYMIAKKRNSKAGILCFYKSEHDNLSQPCSTIDLSECTDINYSTSVNSYSSQRYEFKLYLRKHDLHLATNSHENTEKWISAIKQLLPRISKPAYDLLQQEVNNLHTTESNLRAENSRLMELVEYYKKNVKSLEETNKQLEGEVTRLKDELSLFKLENSNQQITNNNMHIKNLNQNMTKNLDKIYNKVSEQEKIEDIFTNGIKKLNEKIDCYSGEVKESTQKNEEGQYALSETLNSLKDMVEKRTQELAKMVDESQEKVQRMSEENGTQAECLSEIRTEVQRFAKEIPESMEITFKKILDEKLESKLDVMTKEMNAMNERQVKLLELCTAAAEKMNAKQDANHKLVNRMMTQLECNNMESKNYINIANDDLSRKLDELYEYIEMNTKSSSAANVSNSNSFILNDYEKFMRDVRIALSDIETRISRVKGQEQSNHDITVELIKAMNDKINFFQQHLLTVITEKIRKFMIEDQDEKKNDLASLENRMDELKIIINTYSNSLKCAVDPTTVEYIDYQNVANLRYSNVSLDREASIDNSRIVGIESSLKRVLKEVSKYNSSMNLLSKQNSLSRLTSSSMNLNSMDTRNATLELVSSINNSLIRIQTIIGSTDTLCNDTDLKDQFKFIKTILETNKTDLEKVFVKQKNIDYLNNQITSLKSERDLLVEEVNNLS
ncbi:PH-domain-containing protein [Piromyces finnis]|uniref:PH-domain-containing protein n=1 Tax=Piromyces finnis TaxID=1754191 RepID=A0A1Y1UV55_9FUNG|nr:PH-domain-containing protein [Piromyces finnis]|eukprot:ORX41922.1 PH-domain-containing protein [Piromyces finnis]